MIIARPAETPDTTPSVAPTVAIAVVPLLQVPDGVASERFAVAPTHAAGVPVMLAGSG